MLKMAIDGMREMWMSKIVQEGLKGNGQFKNPDGNKSKRWQQKGKRVEQETSVWQRYQLIVAQVDISASIKESIKTTIV